MIDPSRQPKDHYLSHFDDDEAKSRLMADASQRMRLYIVTLDFFPGYKRK